MNIDGEDGVTFLRSSGSFKDKDFKTGPKFLHVATSGYFQPANLIFCTTKGPTLSLRKDIRTPESMARLNGIMVDFSFNKLIYSSSYCLAFLLSYRQYINAFCTFDQIFLL